MRDTREFRDFLVRTVNASIAIDGAPYPPQIASLELSYVDGKITFEELQRGSDDYIHGLVRAW
jgi:hypothetical protein